MHSPSQSSLARQRLPASPVRQRHLGVRSSPWTPKSPLQARQPSGVLGTPPAGTPRTPPFPADAAAGEAADAAAGEAADAAAGEADRSDEGDDGLAAQPTSAITTHETTDGPDQNLSVSKPSSILGHW